MDRRRLPATLQSNRSDIKSLNDRANLIKIINNRENALKKRKELMNEYNDIMKRLHEAQMKKKKALSRSRGGVRNSRSWEIRRQEQYKRGERVKEEVKDVSVPEVSDLPKKTKKVRSQKQIEAFEKARKKRAENIAIKKSQPKKKKTTITEDPPSIIDSIPPDLKEEYYEHEILQGGIQPTEPKLKYQFV